MDFAKRLRTLREKKRYSVKDVAIFLNISSNTYREWELGRSIRGEMFYPKLAELFEVDLTYLITGINKDHDLLTKTIEEIDKCVKELKKIAGISHF